MLEKIVLSFWGVLLGFGLGACALILYTGEETLFLAVFVAPKGAVLTTLLLFPFAGSMLATRKCFD